MPDEGFEGGDRSRHHRFAADRARFLIGMLGPKPGETILELGCGDGVLTVGIQNLGARVIGIDRTEAMVNAARTLRIDAHRMDGQTLDWNYP